MRHHLRFVALAVVGVVAYIVLIRAFHLLNQASDRALYAGMAVIFGLLLFVPFVVRAIWRML